MEVAYVTGASGFIGRHLSDTLRSGGISVTHGDRIGQDPQDEQRLADRLRGVQTVFHLGGVAHRLASDEEYQRVNSDWPVRLFKAASAVGVRDFVMLSSIKVLGDTAEVPLRVEADYKPGDAYARSKVSAETSLRREAGSSGTSLHIVRPPLVYGSGVKANFISLLKLARWGMSGLPIPLGSAIARRSLVSVNNLCDLISKIPGSDGGTYHVSDGEDVSVRDLLILLSDSPIRLVRVRPQLMRIAARLIGSESVYSRLFCPLRVDLNDTVARLNWRPPYAMQSELKATMHWYLHR